MKSILITGCNRGIGLGLVKYLSEGNNSLQHIIATCRNPKEAPKLQDVLKTNPGKVHILQLGPSHVKVGLVGFYCTRDYFWIDLGDYGFYNDLKDFNSHDRISKEVFNIVGNDGLNVLFNNAGVTTKFTRVNLVKAEQMIENLTVNTVAPLMLTKALIPLLKQASTVNASLPMGTNRAAVINVSSIMGSIADNNQGGFYPYRSSKAALNAVTRSLSLDLKPDNILVMSLHPGWIKTDMGGAQAPLTLDNAIPTIVQLLGQLDQSHNGGFYQYDGKSLPW